MPNVLVDIDIENSPEALKLAELTGDSRAWIYAFRLWSWGIRHNLVDGKMRQTGDQLCTICAPPRRLRGHLLGYLIDSGLVYQGGDQHGQYFFLIGWERNMAYLNEKKYDRDRKKAAKIEQFSVGSSDGTGEDFRRKLRKNSGSNSPASSSSSSSLDLASLDQGDAPPTESAPPTSDQPADPIADNAAKAGTSKTSRVLELERRYLAGMAKNGKLLMRVTLDERAALEELSATAADPEAAIDRYLAQPKESFHGGAGWPIRLLVRDVGKFSGSTESTQAVDNFGRPHVYVAPKSEGLDYVRAIHSRNVK